MTPKIRFIAGEKSIILEGCWDFSVPKKTLQSLKKILQTQVKSIEFSQECKIDFVFGTFLLEQIYISAYLVDSNDSPLHNKDNLGDLPKIIAPNHIKTILQTCENLKAKKPRGFSSMCRVYMRGARRFGRRSLNNLGKFVYEFSQSFYQLCGNDFLFSWAMYYQARDSLIPAFLSY